MDDIKLVQLAEKMGDFVNELHHEGYKAKSVADEFLEWSIMIVWKYYPLPRERTRYIHRSVDSVINRIKKEECDVRKEKKK